MRILITGGNGFIGSRLCQSLRLLQHEVCIVDPVSLVSRSGTHFLNQVSKYRRSLVGDSRHYLGSTLQQDFLRRSIEEFKPEMIYHLGMISSARESGADTHLSRESIVQSTRFFIEEIQKWEYLCKLVLASSSMVYGNFSLDFVDENYVPDPVNIYGKHKRDAEVLILNAGIANAQFQYSIVRPISVFGPGDDCRRVASKMIFDALSMGKIVLSNPQLRTDFTFIEDVVEGFIQAGLNPNSVGQVFNISSSRSTSLLELAQAIARQIGRVEIQIIESSEPSVKRGALDCSKAGSLLAFKSNTSFEVAIEKTISYFKDILQPSIF